MIDATDELTSDKIPIRTIINDYKTTIIQVHYRG